VEAAGLTQEVRAELEQLEALLHNAIIGSLRNPIIDRSYHRVHNFLRILMLDRKMTAPLVLRSLREHLAIIGACRRRKSYG
jgi:DNA-binding GntR family transcriptional regulator